MALSPRPDEPDAARRGLKTVRYAINNE